MISNIDEFILAAQSIGFNYSALVLAIIVVGCFVFIGSTLIEVDGKLFIMSICLIGFFVCCGYLLSTSADISKKSILETKDSALLLESQIKTIIEENPKDKQLQKICAFLDKEIVLGNIDSYEQQNNRFIISWETSMNDYDNDYEFMLTDDDRTSNLVEE